MKRSRVSILQHFGMRQTVFKGKDKNKVALDKQDKTGTETPTPTNS